MSTEVVVPSSEELNKQLKKAIAQIDKKLKALGFSGENATVPTFKTGGGFKYNENDSNTINILNNNNPVYLGQSLAMLLRVKREYTEVMEGLGLCSFPVCTWLGQPIDNWIHDIEIRVKITTNAHTISELLKSKKELSGFMSQEDRLFTALTKVSDLLKS